MLSYSVRFLNDNPFVFGYIPVFILFTIGLVALIVWQHCCFISKYSSNSNFWDFSNSGFFGILNILEFIWGLQFLRDAFNFCVSGCAVDWYWRGRCDCYTPYQRLVCNHWGSVVGGSFLNAFFEIPTLFIELLVCHPQTCCSALGTCCYNTCSCCVCFFDLVRTDAYSYINLTGIPYCNSARQCKMLCDRSHQFIGTHSAMKHYRFAAHIFCVASVALMTYFILKYRVHNFGFWHVAIGVTMIYAIVTWFIDIHADSA
eukprot:GHVR01131432.1.p1 GENE.GHVR01131432.1~~GHVR01131432.1.p1  ORF type:complete len:258 (+),score=-12.44 GHVR01131432.1:1127-1900(+)